MIRKIAKIFALVLIIIMFIFSCADLPGGSDFREIPPLEEDDIVCKDFSREITLFFHKDEDAPSGVRNFHFSVGEDYDFWVLRRGQIFIRDVDLVFDKSFATEYLFIEDLGGNELVSVYKVRDGDVGAIEWNGKKDLVPLISKSIMDNAHEGKFWKVLKLRYRHDEKKMFGNETSLKIFLMVRACGDFTNLSPVLWDRLSMVFWN